MMNFERNLFFLLLFFFEKLVYLIKKNEKIFFILFVSFCLPFFFVVVVRLDVLEVLLFFCSIFIIIFKIKKNTFSNFLIVVGGLKTVGVFQKTRNEVGGIFFFFVFFFFFFIFSFFFFFFCLLLSFPQWFCQDYFLSILTH